MSISYVLTFDYELFGSGKGSVKKHLVEPTNKILRRLKKFNVKATFFIEQLEIDAIIALKDEYGPHTKEHQEALLVEQQLVDIAVQGHDIQLHLHPQWFNAKYKDGVWGLNFDFWRFGSLPYKSTDDHPGKFDLLKSGKHSLQQFVRKYKPDYKCIGFRAGGYNVGLGKDTLDALSNNDFFIDSSICPGFFSNSSLSDYDYTGISNTLNHWCPMDGMLPNQFEGNKGSKFVELPLITMRSKFFEKLSLARIYSNVTNFNNKKIEFIGSYHPSFPENKDEVTNSNFDICLSSRVQINRFKKIISEQSLKGREHFILIGHPKDFSIFSPLNRLESVFGKGARFITISDAYSQIVD